MTHDLTLLSTTFPELQEPQVPRDNLIGLLRDRFSPDRKIIVVQGPVGSGKTTLLAQFGKAHPDVSFTFFTGTTLLTSDPRCFLLDMCEQMGHALGRATSGIGRLSTDELRQLFLDFYRGVVQVARGQRRVYFFIVDGIEWIVSENREQSIVRLLPTEPGVNIRLLLSSHPGWKPNFIHDRWDIPFFSSRDTEAYLADTGLDSNAIRRIQERCQGMPGYLAAVRRLVAAGSELQLDYDSLPDELRGIFEVEWSRAGVRDEVTLQGLGILAFAHEPLRVSALSEMLGRDEEALARALRVLSFLHVDSKESSVSFISDAYKQFVGDVLSSKRETCEEALIRYYSHDPYTQSSLVLLPAYLAKPASYQGLRELVTSQYLLRSLDVSRDTFLLRRTLGLAATQACLAEDWPLLQQFTLTSAVLRTISTEATHDGEVEALLALGEYGQALEIAYQAILPEDRLELLARVTNQMQHKGISVPQQVIVDVEQMADSVNAIGLGNRAVDIAASLFDLLPEKALYLVERGAGREIGPRSLDIARASLALRLQRDPKELVRSRISDHSLRDFARAYSPRIGKLTAQEILAEVENVSSTSAKLFMITSWCNENRREPSAPVVVEKALETITGDPSYGVSMRLLRQLAEPLKSGPEEAVDGLVDRLELLKNTAIARPAEEALRLELVLVALRARRSRDSSIERTLELYSGLNAQPDLDARCYGIVRILISLAEMDPEDKERFRESIERRLISEFDALLAGSADQFAVTRRILRALTNYDPDMALDLAAKLNTEARRDEAFNEVLSVGIHTRGSTDPAWIRGLVARIVDEERRDVSLVNVVRHFAERGLFESQPSLRSFLQDVEALIDPRDRCIALAHVIASLVSEASAAFKTHLSERLTSSLEEVDELWDLVDLGFWLSSTVASTSPELGRSLSARAKQEVSKTPLADPAFARMYLDCVRLVIRAFAGVVPFSSNLDQQLHRILAAVALVPSHGYQARLLSDLALRLLSKDQPQPFRRIVADEVLPRLENCRNKYARTVTLIWTCPALYEHDPSWTLEQLRQIGSPYRGRALAKLTAYLLSDKPPTDEVDLDGLKGDLDARKARRVTDVLSEVGEDGSLWSVC